MLLFGLIINSFSEYNFKEWTKNDFWLFIYIASINITSSYILTNISWIRVQTNNEVKNYNLKIHNLFENVGKNLPEAKKNWEELIVSNFSKRIIYNIINILEELDHKDINIEVEDIYNNVISNKFLEYIEQNSIVESKSYPKKINKKIRTLKRCYDNFQNYKNKFNDAERRYKEGQLVKDFKPDIEDKVGKLIKSLFSLTMTFVGLIKWDNNLIFKLIIMLVFIIIHVAMSFLETKDLIIDYKKNWEDIESTLIQTLKGNDIDSKK